MNGEGSLLKTVLFRVLLSQVLARDLQVHLIGLPG
jgi:hypothetical protein